MAGDMLKNAAQALEFIVGLAMFAALWRLPRAEPESRAFLLAFIVFLAGTFARELVVRYGGPSGWLEHHLMWSAIARCVQIAGALLYVRETFRQRCGEWPWIAALVGTIAYAALT